MTAVCTAAVRLPDYLASAPAGASVQHRRRYIYWTLTEPGRIHRNDFHWAHLTVTERTPWSGEPLWLGAGRRSSASSAVRQSFTDMARAAMHAEIVPAVARYGFDRLWTELTRTPTTYRSPATARAEADEAARTAEWWRLKAELVEMHQAGVVEFEAVPQDETRYGQRGHMVRVARAHQSRFTTEYPAARALVDGVQVGWVLDTADLVPLDDVLRSPTPTTGATP